MKRWFARCSPTAVSNRQGHRGLPAFDIVRVHPEGIDGSGDFSFMVIGDTGEGDASQHVLRDQLLAVANQPDVRFVVHLVRRRVPGRCDEATTRPSSGCPSRA